MRSVFVTSLFADNLSSFNQTFSVFAVAVQDETVLLERNFLNYHNTRKTLDVILSGDS